MGEEKKPIRILHVVGQLNLGGAESRIMDLYRNIDREAVQFDFVEHTSAKCFFEDEITALGGQIYRVPRFRIFNWFGYKRAWKKLFEAHMDQENNRSEFALIQGHMTSTASIYLPIAKKCGVPVTVAHARSAGVDAGIKGFVTKKLRKNLPDRADFLFTCSDYAAKAVFGQKAINEKNITFIPNAIDTDKYIFSDELRREVRKELGIEDKYVFGHVGRFHYAKNHEFLLRIFKEILNKCDNAVLILLGDGGRMDEMQQLAKTLGIEKQVMFLGAKKDIYRYYPAMDYFVYPSRYEGLPGTVVEAEASGLKVMMSDEICPEVMVTDLVKTESLSTEPAVWAERILGDGPFATRVGEMARTGEAVQGLDDGLFKIEVNREAYASQVALAGFDVKAQAKLMKAFYEKAAAKAANAGTDENPQAMA